MTLLINIIQTLSTFPYHHNNHTHLCYETVLSICFLHTREADLTLTSSKGNLRDKVEELSDFVDIPKRENMAPSG